LKTTQIAIVLLLLMTQSLAAWSFNLAPQKVPFAVPDVSFTSQKKQHSLAEYKGQKVMLWLFSTWCHTCVASVKAMQAKRDLWQKTGLLILAVRNFDNGGYPGADMPAFMKKFAPQVSNLDNWIIGEASKQMDQKLNARKFPDIYFLIDKKGWVQTVSTAPNVTMGKILVFATGTSK
jgi:thiol-disulfide isomerase/thioredoxin